MKRVAINVLEQSQQYFDEIARNEIHNMLRILAIHTENASKDELVLLKRYLKKLVEY